MSETKTETAFDHPECWERLVKLAREGKSHGGVLCIRTNKKVRTEYGNRK